MATGYHFRDGADFDSRCAPHNGGALTIANSTYRMSDGSELVRRYAATDVGPSALSVYGESGFYASNGSDIAAQLCAINRNAIPANVPYAISLTTSQLSAYANITFMNDGRIRRTVGDSSAPNTPTYPDRWGNSQISGGSYQVRFTLLSGNVSGSFGSWLSLSSSRGVTCSVEPMRTQSGRVRVEWRYGIGGTIFSDDFDIEATSGIV